ncbi:MAG TPA: methyltransferase domain-containing protein, partial [Actinomycetota bacterium]|nr:methyltransferase domain-containing protein [Actinomycetota bacterium]
ASSDVVADIGCGIGGPARRLARTVGCAVVGVDVLPSLVALARDRAEAEAPMPGATRTSFVAGSAERLPLASARFDQAWALGVAAHVDVEMLAGEAVRILRPGGALCLSEVFWDGRRPPRFAERAPAPWRALRRSEVVRALEGAGFVDVGSLPWPGRAFQRDGDVADPFLRADLLDGRLRSGLIVARRP